MTQALQGHTALITGSTGGIGLAVAEALAAAGTGLILHGLATPEEAAPVAAGLAARHGVTVRYHQAELARPDAIAAMLAAAGNIDILVNNAAARHFAPVEAMPPEAWDEDIAVNLSAAFHLIRLTLPGMHRRGWGRLVNMAASSGLIGARARIGYVTTKTALIGLTRAVALETAESGITCNALCPGSALTPNIDGRIRAAMAAEGTDRATAEARFLAGKQPTGRFVEATAIAAMVAMLCGPAGRDITGAVLPMDGGWSAA